MNDHRQNGIFTLFLVSRQVAQEAQDVFIKSHQFIRTIQYGPSSTVLKKGPLPKVCGAYSASLPQHLEARAEDQIVLTIRFGTGCGTAVAPKDG